MFVYLGNLYVLFSMFAKPFWKPPEQKRIKW